MTADVLGRSESAAMSAGVLVPAEVAMAAAVVARAEAAWATADVLGPAEVLA